MKCLQYKVGLLIASMLVCASFAAAQTEGERGIELYKKGDYRGAIVVLKKITARSEREIVAAHYLGLALEKENQSKEASKIFESNLDNGLKLAAEKVEEKLGGARDAGDKEPVWVYVQKKIGGEIAAALASAERLEALDAKKGASDKRQSKILSLRYFTESTEKPDSENSKITPVKIIKKPFATGAEGETGTIRLWVLFLPNGKIGLIAPVNRLSNRLTGIAIDAARGIKFNPALRDGKPISIVKQIEYSFSTF